MDTRQAYNFWAAQYDTDHNRTRDLEGAVLREILGRLSFRNCLEIGCGTGKNTEWLVQQAEHITAVDLSEEMMAKASARVASDKVQFVQADVTTSWNFLDRQYDLINFSLVLEHIENLSPILEEATKALIPAGYIYIGELHPFKQYAGSKARFEAAEGVIIPDCYTHHTSDFIQAAKVHGLQLIDLQEHFDDEDRTGIPRILTLLFQKATAKS